MREGGRGDEVVMRGYEEEVVVISYLGTVRLALGVKDSVSVRASVRFRGDVLPRNRTVPMSSSIAGSIV